MIFRVNKSNEIQKEKEEKKRKEKERKGKKTLYLNLYSISIFYILIEFLGVLVLDLFRVFNECNEVTELRVVCFGK